MKPTLTAYKFSNTAISTQPNILNGKTPLEFLKDKYTQKFSFGIDNLKRSGVYKIHGWCFDFKPFLKRYYVEQHGMIHIEYAVNKTAIRTSTYGVIDKICERK